MNSAATNSSTRSIGYIGGLLGIIQGLVWATLSLLAAIIYLKGWTPKVVPETYGTCLSFTIVTLYLNADLVYTGDILIKPSQFFIWVVLYFVLSVIWFALSTFVMMEKGSDKVRKAKYLMWAICTIVVSVCDIIFCGILAADYATFVKDFYQAPIIELAFVVLACGIMMTIAARGFALWVVNLYLATHFILVATRNSWPEQQSPLNAGLINGYQSETQRSQGFANPGYANTWDPNRKDFNRSNSFVTGATVPQQRPQPENLAKLPPIASTNERLAKIGRRGMQTPSHNVPPPKPPQSYIYPTTPRVPSPDYSPPSSPSPLKPALKNKPYSRYNSSGGYSNGGYSNSSRY